MILCFLIFKVFMYNTGVGLWHFFQLGAPFFGLIDIYDYIPKLNTQSFKFTKVLTYIILIIMFVRFGVFQNFFCLIDRHSGIPT